MPLPTKRFFSSRKAGSARVLVAACCLAWGVSVLAQAPGAAVSATTVAPAGVAVPAATAPAAGAGAGAGQGGAAACGRATVPASALPAGALPAAPARQGGPAAAGPGGRADGPAAQPGAAGEAAADGRALSKADAGSVTSTVQTDFQLFVQATTGRNLPLYGFDLFSRGAFTASQGAAVPASYVLGPGDEVVAQAYGLVDFTERLIIDREGRVLVPKAGPLTLAGVSLGDAEKVLTAHLGKIYRNFSLTVTMGRVRSAEVFVVGQARNPGKHVVSGLSTLINALFETGGPNANGSLRAVELRRAGKAVAKVDVYQFLAKGDNSSDVKLQPGDVIFIPPAGPRAAVLGTVNSPAIYELKAEDTIQSVLDLTGGLPVLAAPQKAQLERINPSREVARYVEDFVLDITGLRRPLQAGDVLTVFQISPQIASAVTLQGNVAAPMRYTWKPGMRVSDLLSDPKLLIPTAYWLQVNAGGQSDNPSRPEVNLDYAAIQRLDPVTLRTRIVPFNPRKAVAKVASEDLELRSGDIITIYRPGETGADTNDTVTVRGEVVGGTQRFVWRPGFTVKDIIPSAQWLVDYYNYWQRRNGLELRNDINWDYGQVVRRLPDTLQTRTFNFNLGGAVLQGRAQDNIALQPGDQITLFTTRELPVPVEKRIRLVTVSGEVRVPGVYQAAPGETLRQLIERAGGFTAEAYPFGLDFRRESTRAAQQQNLDRVVQRLEADALSNTQSRLQNLSAGDSAQAAQAAQAAMQAEQLRLASLRKLKASGRVSLQLDPERIDLPSLFLEDGDAINVPNRPAFVGVFGAVNNENALLWRPGMSVGDVVARAGPTTFADVSESYVLRADGSVLNNSEVMGLFGFGGIRSVKLQPGDTVVVPERPDRETLYTTLMRGAKDITTIFYQFGLGAAAIKTLRN